MYISKSKSKEDVINKIANKKLFLWDLSKDLQDDKDVVLEAVKSDIYGLKYVSDRLRYDKDVVLIAVKCNGLLLSLTSEKLKDDRDVVLAAIKESLLALRFASERLQNDKNFLEMLEKEKISNWSKREIFWYKEKMQILCNIREQELITTSIIPNIIKSKKIKF